MIRKLLAKILSKLLIDWYAHGITSAFLTFVITTFLVVCLEFYCVLAAIVSVFATIMVGLYKEYLDEYASSEDLISDAVGAISGAILALVIFVIALL